MKEISEEQALRLQKKETMGWNKPGYRVPGVRTKKNNDRLYAVFMKPFSCFVNDVDQFTHLYFSKDENQQLMVLVTENRAFDKENIGKLRPASNATLTVWENGIAIWHNKSALSHCKYNENLNRLLRPLFKSMETDPSWDKQLSMNIRNTIFEGIQMEKDLPYSILRRQNKPDKSL